MDSLIQQLRRYLIKEELNNVYLSIDSEFSQYVNKFKRINQFDFKNIITSTSNKEIIPFDKQSIPYFFTLNESNRIIHLFVPNKKKFEETKFYLDFIKSKYW